ncbi:MAG TPA: contractile injection system tape measure protein [Niastella sp.]
MGFAGKHIILKQVIDLQYHGQADGFELQRQVSDWCHRHLIPHIEDQLGRLRTKGKVYKIDKLEIDVQIDSAGNWMAGATAQIVQKLYNQVEQEIQKCQDDPALNPVTYPQLFVEAFIYFLQHGHLPWWSPVTTHHVWHEELENLLITGFGEKAKAQLLQLLKQHDVQQRVLYQVPDELFIKLMVQINGGIEKDITNLINDIKNLVKDAEERKTVLTLFRQSAMAFIYEVNSQQFAEHVYAHFVHQLSARGHLQHIPINNGKYNTTALKKALEQQHAGTSGYEKEGKEIKKGKEKDNAFSIAKGASSVKQEGIYIQNAGLVITAPFLPALFKKLALFDGDAIRDINRAVYLVQYMASGRERVAEFELGMAKILCGIESDTPVDTHMRLTKEEKHEMNDLLASAIEYWEILKDTTPEGLRQSFLQRPGKLQFVRNEWLLQVEQKPWDVLLQHLPWNISMMKLPWMPHMLKTEWGYV